MGELAFVGWISKWFNHVRLRRDGVRQQRTEDAAAELLLHRDSDGTDRQP